MPTYCSAFVTDGQSLPFMVSVKIYKLLERSKLQVRVITFSEQTNFYVDYFLYG
jgi:hypothetical protein